MNPFSQIYAWLSKQSWYELWRRKFWSRPDRQNAIKVTVVVAAVTIPALLMGSYYVATTLSLGVLAGALSETDDHPRGRILSLIIKVLGFAFSSLAVALLSDKTILLGLGLGLSSVAFILIGGLSERFRGITFGVILTGIYAMMSIDNADTWYMPTLLLAAGALFQGLFSLVLLYIRPYRLLEEQIARAFKALAAYQKEKANYYSVDEGVKEQHRNKLAIKNVRLVEALDRCRSVMNSYADMEGDTALLRQYLSQLMHLQALHERASSSLQQGERVGGGLQEKEMLEGISQTLFQLGEASELYAYSLLVKIPYKHPAILNWSITALEEKELLYKLEPDHPLCLMVDSLSHSNQTMQKLSGVEEGEFIAPRLSKESRSYGERMKEQLSFQHPRMRHAIRVALSLMLSYAVSEYFSLAQGDWVVLTALMVCQSNFSETRRRFFQRVFGTIFGVILGVLIIQLLPTLEGQMLFLLSSTYLFFLWLKRSYSTSVIFITTYVLSVFNIVSNDGVLMMGPRLLDTFIGALITIIVVRFVWPDWQYTRIPKLLNDSFSKNAAYLEFIILAHQKQLPEHDYSYLVARRDAHRADNALVLAWQNMRLEPKKHQQMNERTMRLTNLNHSLISYLSALGLNRERGDMKKANLVGLANEILEVMQGLQIPMNKDMDEKRKQLKACLHSLNKLQEEACEAVVVLQSRILINIVELTLKIQEQSYACEIRVVK